MFLVVEILEDSRLPSVAQALFQQRIFFFTQIFPLCSEFQNSIRCCRQPSNVCGELKVSCTVYAVFVHFSQDTICSLLQEHHAVKIIIPATSAVQPFRKPSTPNRWVGGRGTGGILGGDCSAMPPTKKRNGGGRPEQQQQHLPTPGESASLSLCCCPQSRFPFYNLPSALCFKQKAPVSPAPASSSGSPSGTNSHLFQPQAPDQPILGSARCHEHSKHKKRGKLDRKHLDLHGVWGQ